MSKSNSQLLDRARDELFSHINRCGVLRANVEQQTEWMEDTMGYMSERFPDLTEEDLVELRAIGLRFCQPVIGHGPTDEDPVEEKAASTADAESAAA